MRPKIDLAELAKLRFVEKWPLQRLARHYGRGLPAIYQALRELEKESSS
jgi:hypothetical protein